MIKKLIRIVIVVTRTMIMLIIILMMTRVKKTGIKKCW